MIHDQIVAALKRDYRLVDARESHRDCYPDPQARGPKTVRRIWDDPMRSGEPDPTGFGEGCVI